jgi:hypothetical protein
LRLELAATDLVIRRSPDSTVINTHPAAVRSGAGLSVALG